MKSDDRDNNYQMESGCEIEKPRHQRNYERYHDPQKRNQVQRSPHGS